MPLDLECGFQYRVKKTGEVVEIEICSVTGTGAVLIFTKGVLSGISGNLPNKDVAVKIAKAIGKSKADVAKLTI